MPVRGLMVEPFPEPGAQVRAAMETLQLATVNPPETEHGLQRIADLPRPWDPASCSGTLRGQVWEWLEQVAAWINTQHLWSVHRPGVPECWPAHPHLVHDLAVVACARYYAAFAATPAQLEEWHRYSLPLFLDRIRERLEDGCQPGKHMAPPRAERNAKHTAEEPTRARAARYADDVNQKHGAWRR